MFEIEGATAAFGRRIVFERLSLTLPPAHVLAVVGRSGCGKTTLVHVAAGLHAPADGRVTLDGAPLHAGDPRIGYVPQHYGLFPWFTAVGNVELGLRLRGAERREKRRRAESALARVGLAGLGGRYPAQLSGGEQQRVALARMQALAPEVLLLDEPFSSLDAFTRESLQEELLRLPSSGRRATLLVTHDLEEAVFVADRIGIMSGQPARLKLFDNPWQRPPRERTREHRATGEFAAAVTAVRQTFREAERAP